MSKTVDSNAAKYCYDGDKVLAEYKGDTLVRKFIYGLGIDEPKCFASERAFFVQRLRKNLDMVNTLPVKSYLLI